MSTRYTYNDYTYDDTNKAFYEKAYDILVEHAGASKDGKFRFVQSFTQVDYRTSEFRFCGNIGFGGKFWRNNGLFYVSCYTEERGPKKDKLIAKINDLLAKLVAEMNPNRYGP